MAAEMSSSREPCSGTLPSNSGIAALQGRRQFLIVEPGKVVEGDGNFGRVSNFKGDFYAGADSRKAILHGGKRTQFCEPVGGCLKVVARNVRSRVETRQAATI